MYHKYGRLEDHSGIRNLLIMHQLTIGTVAKRLDVPYGSVKNVAKKILTKREYANLTRKRQHFPEDQRRDVVKKARRMRKKLDLTIEEAAYRLDMNANTLRAWMKRYPAKKKKVRDK